MKSVYVVIIYTLRNFKGICGQQVGADGSGDYAVLVTGDTFDDAYKKSELEIDNIKKVMSKFQKSSLHVFYDWPDTHGEYFKVI